MGHQSPAPPFSLIVAPPVACTVHPFRARTATVGLQGVEIPLNAARRPSPYEVFMALELCDPP